MKNIRITAAAYELFKEKAKQARERDVPSYLEKLARS